MAKKKNINSKNKRKQSKKNQEIKLYGEMRNEIKIILTLLISVILFLSNFNLSGKIGQYLSGFIFGMIGILAYILPFVLFFTTAFYISNAGNKKAGRKIMSLMVFMLNFTALIQLITMVYDPELKIFDYYTNSSSLRSGGGIIGGIQVMIYCTLFDTFVTYIILITIMVISFIVITGKGVFTYISRKTKGYRQKRKELKKVIEEETQKNALTVIDGNKKRRPPKIVNIDNLNPVTDNIIQDKKQSKAKSRHKDPLDMHEIILDKANEDTKTITEELDKKELDNTNLEDDNIHIKNYYNQSLTNDKTKVNPPLDINQKLKESKYTYPPLSLLSKAKNKSKGMSDAELKRTAMKLQKTLESFGVKVNVTNISCGPAVTRYELQPEHGVKVSRITGLADDIKLNLAASDIRIEAPIPGKAAVGIEVPNTENSMVSLREIIDSNEFNDHSSDIAFAVGKDIGGQNIVTDIAKMPHLLIAGATGSGKSVCINTIIMSLIFRSNPSDIRLIMIDPKVVELSVYNGIPHLLIPVVTDPKKASAALAWAVAEMTDRYKKFAELSVRDLKGYNNKIKKPEYSEDEEHQMLPQIVIIIDELSDLMMVAPGEVEDAICRLAQMARAAGLHLIIATQRPSVNVITGLIKANIPSRIAFAVSSSIDSRTILDGSGAEKLLGKGDMLFFPSGIPKPIRVQGAFVSDKEVSAVVDFLKKNNSEAEYNEEVNEQITKSNTSIADAIASERDEYFIEAAKFIIEKDKASIGMLQRIYRIGFNRAARMMDQLSDIGVVGPDEGTKPRQVLMNKEQFDQWLEEEN
ncbi:MAG TPA: DNA translocase FtsK [Clostridiales bacterium]|nr:DNA translocase FtsK [Clostridiales bacterium]